MCVLNSTPTPEPIYQWILITPHHIPALMAFEKICFEEKSVFDENSLAAFLSSPFVFGYFLTEKGHEDKPLAASLFQNVGEEAELISIMVHPGARGRGLGEKVLKHGARELFSRQSLELFLEVRPSNAAAITLYSKFGAFKVGHRPCYYKDGEDADVYRIDLPV